MTVVKMIEDDEERPSSKHLVSQDHGHVWNSSSDSMMTHLWTIGVFPIGVTIAESKCIKNFLLRQACFFYKTLSCKHVLDFHFVIQHEISITFLRAEAYVEMRWF